MTYGGSEFIKMIQKNNMYIFLLVLGGGQDKPAWTACPTGGEDKQGGGARYPGTACPPGGQRLACPPGGKLSRGQDKLGHRPSWIEPLLS